MTAGKMPSYEALSPPKNCLQTWKSIQKVSTSELCLWMIWLLFMKRNTFRPIYTMQFSHSICRIRHSLHLHILSLRVSHTTDCMRQSRRVNQPLQVDKGHSVCFVKQEVDTTFYPLIDNDSWPIKRFPLWGESGTFLEYPMI